MPNLQTQMLGLVAANGSAVMTSTKDKVQFAGKITARECTSRPDTMSVKDECSGAVDLQVCRGTYEECCTPSTWFDF